jgi:hypothetical protein
MPRANKAVFSFQGDPGEFITQGTTENRTDRDSVFTVKAVEGRNSLEIRIDSGQSDPWSLEFAAPKGKRLRTGVYTCATRYGFQKDDEPGFTMAGSHRGHNASIAEFTIRHIQYNKAGKLVTFVAEFVQSGEHTVSAVQGKIYYHRKPEAVAIENAAAA